MTSKTYQETLEIDDSTGGITTHGFLPVDAVPTVATTLIASQTIATGTQAVLFGTFTIPTGLTLTIVGTGLLAITNIIYSAN